MNRPVPQAPPPDAKTVTDADARWVTQVLGRAPAARLLAVPARDAEGRPRVVTAYPLLEKAGRMEPFPTLHWLVDPALTRHVSDLERRGAVGRLEAWLAEEPALHDAYRDDHRRYIARRLACLPPVDRVRAGVLKERGIAGLADWARVKCLHAHVAHHLADPLGNTVARLAHQRLGLKWSPDAADLSPDGASDESPPPADD